MNFLEAIKQTFSTTWSCLLQRKLFVIPALIILLLLEAHIGEGIKLFKELFGLGVEHQNWEISILATLFLVMLITTLCFLGAAIVYLKDKLSKKEAKVADSVKSLL
jgi:hypothetical protein